MVPFYGVIQDTTVSFYWIPSVNFMSVFTTKLISLWLYWYIGITDPKMEFSVQVVFGYEEGIRFKAPGDSLVPIYYNKLN